MYKNMTFNFGLCDFWDNCIKRGDDLSRFRYLAKNKRHTDLEFTPLEGELQ
jgi:hypothetical protein